MQSEPGPTGGYVVTIDLADVCVLDVIEAVDGPTATGRCVLEDRPSGAGRGAGSGGCGEPPAGLDDAAEHVVVGVFARATLR